MNKTQRNKLINKLVYKAAEKLGYEVDMTEIDVEFISPTGNKDNNISYRRSSQDISWLNWACGETKLHADILGNTIGWLKGKSDDELVNLDK
jgi:hypothetical protein